MPQYLRRAWLSPFGLAQCSTSSAESYTAYGMKHWGVVGLILQFLEIRHSFWCGSRQFHAINDKERLLSLFHQGFSADVLVGVPIQCLVKEGTDVVLDQRMMVCARDYIMYELDAVLSSKQIVSSNSPCRFRSFGANHGHHYATPTPAIAWNA